MARVISTRPLRVQADTGARKIYALYAAEVVLRGSRKETIYYFTDARNPRSRNAREMAEIPRGRYINENPRNGFLTLKKNPQIPLNHKENNNVAI